MKTHFLKSRDYVAQEFVTQILSIAQEGDNLLYRKYKPAKSDYLGHHIHNFFRFESAVYLGHFLKMRASANFQKFQPFQLHWSSRKS